MKKSLVKRFGFLRSDALSIVLSGVGVLMIGGFVYAASPGEGASPVPAPTTVEDLDSYADDYTDNEAGGEEPGDIPGASNTPPHVVSLLAGHSTYRVTASIGGAVTATTRAGARETLWRMRSTDDWDVSFESIARPGLYLVAGRAPGEPLLARDPGQRGHWIFAAPGPMAPETTYGQLLADADPPACLSLARTTGRPSFVLTRICGPGDGGLVRIAPADGSASLQARRE